MYDKNTAMESSYESNNKAKRNINQTQNKQNSIPFYSCELSEDESIMFLTRRKTRRKVLLLLEVEVCCACCVGTVTVPVHDIWYTFPW